MATLLKTHAVPVDKVFALRGSGGMAKAVACALRDAGFRAGFIVARSADAWQALARTTGFEWRADIDGAAAFVAV